MDEPELRRIFAHNIKRQLDLSGMNQKELAKAVGASSSMVSLWCMGKNVPRTGYLSKLTEVFHCKMTDLLLDNEKDSQPIEGYESGPVGYDQLTDSEKALIDAMVAKILEQRSQQ